MTILKGRPEVPTGTPLAVRLLWDVPLQGGPSRLSVKMLDGVWSWDRLRWEKDAATPLTFPHPRVGQNDAALKGPLTAVVSVGAGAAMTSQTLYYLLQSFETAPGELDMTVDPQPATFLPSETLFGLIAQLNTASTRYETDLAAFATAVAALSQTTQGLAVLNVRSVNAVTDTGYGVLWGLEVSERLPLFLDTLGKTRIHDGVLTTATIGTLNVASLNLTQPLTVPEISSTLLRAGGFILGNVTFAPAPEGSGVLFAVVDKNDRMSIWITADGVFHAAQFGTEFGSGTGTGGGGSTPSNVTNRTLDLEGGDLTSTDSRISVFGVTDRFDRMPLWLGPDGVFHLARPLGAPSFDLYFWGDEVAASVAARILVPPGRVVPQGWAEQTSADVAARFGAVGRIATFTAAAPTAGVYPLTLLDTNLSPLSGLVTRTLSGRLSGVRGLLSRTIGVQTDSLTNRGAYYTFTPDAAVPIETGQVHPFLPANPSTLETTLISVGRADIGAVTASPPLATELAGLGISTNIQAIIQTLSGRHDRYVVCGLLNTKTELVGAGLERILAYNARIAQVAGDRYFNVRAVFCRNADGTWRADGSPDPVYMADNSKLNATGLQRFADALKAFIQERGFYA